MAPSTVPSVRWRHLLSHLSGQTEGIPEIGSQRSYSLIGLKEVLEYSGTSPFRNANVLNLLYPGSQGITREYWGLLRLRSACQRIDWHPAWGQYFPQVLIMPYKLLSMEGQQETLSLPSPADITENTRTFTTRHGALGGCILHVRYWGTGTLTWVNTNISEQTYTFHYFICSMKVFIRLYLGQYLFPFPEPGLISISCADIIQVDL